MTRHNRALHVIFFTLIVVALLTPSIPLAGEMPLHVKALLEKANLENGKLIYDTGKHLSGGYISFKAGPHWLHSDGGGCAACHGKNGRGNSNVDSCFSAAPPIAYKFLAGNGYPATQRANGEHPIFTEKSLRRLLEYGFKPQGDETDYCMPRWNLSDKNYSDLLGYLIELDKHP